MDGDHRDPRARAGLRARQPALSRRHLATAGAREHATSARRGAGTDRALRRGARRRDRRGRALRPLGRRRSVPGRARRRGERHLGRVACVQRHERAPRRASAERHGVGHRCRVGARRGTRAERDHDPRRPRAVPRAFVARRAPWQDRAGPATAPAGRAGHRGHGRAGGRATSGLARTQRARRATHVGAAADLERRCRLEAGDHLRPRSRRRRRPRAAHRPRRRRCRRGACRLGSACAPIPIDVVASPFRDLGGPLLGAIRAITADPDAICVVVLPEIISPHRWQRIMHNQRGLFIKRLLLSRSA